MKTMTRDLCPHRLSRDPEDCWSCARDELVDDLPDVDAAVTAARATTVRDVRVKGGSPNWGLINDHAASFTQDIVHEGNRLLDRMQPLEGAFAVIDAVHQVLGVVDGAGPLLLSWRDRCRQITGAGDRPYLLTHATTVTDHLDSGEAFDRVVAAPTLCPVVDPKDERPCRGRLKVHPANHYATSSAGTDNLPVGSIVCTRDRSHSWSRKQGWLRLLVLLAQDDKVGV